MNDYRFFLPLLILPLLILNSCGSYKVFTGSVNHDASKRNSIVRTNELANYLSSREEIKFTIRAPGVYNSLSDDEKMEWNEVFSQLEKELIKQGHIVKDRELVSLLLQNGDLNASAISKAIDTDIIIEIINIDFDIPNQLKNFSIKEIGLATNFDNWENIDFLDCRIAMLECRATLVEVGNIGGIFKFYVSACDEGKDFYVKMYEPSDGGLDPEKESYVGWNYGNISFKSLTHTYDLNSFSREIAIKKLVAALLKELSANKRSKQTE